MSSKSLKKTLTEKKKVILAGFQLEMSFRWLEVLKELEMAIRDEKAGIIVLPEHALDIIEKNSGKPVKTVLKQLSELSARYQVTMIPGTYIDPENGNVFCPVIYNGKLIANSKKYSQDLTVIDIEGLTVVILICVEIERWQKQQEVLKVQTDLIINPALIRMNNSAVLKYLGETSYSIARQNAGEDLQDLASRAECAIFRIDWAESFEEGYVGTTLCIDRDYQLIHTKQPSGLFIQTI
ncbi:MAG: hypothetical protein ACFFD4_27055 [Candidatus Odinarchaeota archaeon]